MKNFALEELPLSIEIETKQVLKQVTTANRYLAELKGVSETIPNQAILRTCSRSFK